MKTIRDYINLIIESEQTGKWIWGSDMAAPMPVPGTAYSVYATKYYWRFAPDSRNITDLTNTKTKHYLLKIEILSTQYEDQIENMDLDKASKIIQAAFPKMVRELGIMKPKWHLYSPDLGKIIAGNQEDEEDEHNFYAYVTHVIDQS
jgi:hypothetical protein